MRRNEKYYKSLLDTSIDVKEFKEFLTQRLGEALDVKRVAREVIDKNASIRKVLDEIDYHVRLSTEPISDIDYRSVMGMEETMNILNISRGQLLNILKKGDIKFKKINPRVFRPYKWSVERYHNTRDMFQLSQPFIN